MPIRICCYLVFMGLASFAATCATAAPKKDSPATQQTEISDELCAAVLAQQHTKTPAALSPDYQEGVDVYGNAVVPAGGGSQYDFAVPDSFGSQIGVDIGELAAYKNKSLNMGEIPVGEFYYHKGKVYFGKRAANLRELVALEKRCVAHKQKLKDDKGAPAEKPAKSK